MAIAAEDSLAVPDGVLVGLAVFLIDLIDVPLNVAGDKLPGRLPGPLQKLDGPWSGHDLAGTGEATTLVSAIRRDEVVAALAFAGATDEAAFRAHLDRVLISALRPGDSVVLNNWRSTGGRRWRGRCAGQGWGGYRPAYSPDFNPIEKVWAKVKAFLRKARARTTEAIGDALAAALQTITAEDCRNSFAHCGYPATKGCETL